MIALLNAADPDLEARLSRVLERTATLDTGERLAALRKEILAASREAYQRMGYFLTSEMRSLVESVAEHLAELIESSVPFKFSATRPDASLLRSLVTEDPLHGRLLGPHIDNLAGNRAAALLEQLQIGTVQGESWGQILTRIRGTAAGGYRDGVLNTIGRRQAETLARTAVQHFTEAARDATIQENADLFQGVMWISTLDKCTTPTCQRRDGKVWDLSYKPVGHSLEWGAGPGRIHWSCRSTSIPVLKDVSDLRRVVDLDHIDPAERAALDHPVPVTTDFEEWLRTQGEGLQEDVLGVKRAEEFRSGASLSAVWDMRFDRMPAIGGA